MLAAFGIFTSVVGLVGALLAAVLIGFAFAAPVYAFSAGARSEQGFALIYRVGVMPMFLFSGAFFPISNLSTPLEMLARLTPLWHGVELTRMSTLGTWEPRCRRSSTSSTCSRSARRASGGPYAGSPRGW